MKLSLVFLSALMMALAFGGHAEAFAVTGSEPLLISQSVQTGSPTATAEQQPGAPLPGTLDEVRNYEQRQQQSPEVQDFAGGSIGVVAVILLLVIIFLIAD